jgi:hypothetical protein
MMKKYRPVLTVALLAVAGCLGLIEIFNVQSAQAQRPHEETLSLLSRSCSSSQYFATPEPEQTISIGRELFSPIFSLAPYYDDEPGFLTCNLSSNNTNAVPPSVLRLQFGLPDTANSEVRITVSAFVDGESWGSVTIAPRDRVTVWDIDVIDTRSISLEVACIARCANFDFFTVYFVKANLEFLGGSTLETEPSSSTDLTNSTGSTDMDSSPRYDENPQTSEVQPEDTNPSLDVPGTIQRGAETLRTIENILDVFR